jgi:hypothetical protein
MPEMLTPAPGPACVLPPTQDVKQADTVARTAYSVMLADLPPQMNETVTPFFQQAARLIAAVGDAYFEAWRSFSTHTADTAGAHLRPDSVPTWLSLARQTVRSLGIGLDIAERVAKHSDIAREAAMNIRARLPDLERLAADLAACHDHDDLRALAVRHYPLDEEAFARQVKSHPFVPTQEMLDEDWSDHIPKKGG